MAAIPTPRLSSERGPDGELIVHEGMPERWHYTVQLSREKVGVYGRIVVSDQ